MKTRLTQMVLSFVESTRNSTSSGTKTVVAPASRRRLFRPHLGQETACLWTLSN